MASHIKSIASSDIPKVDRRGFYTAARHGMFLFTSGRAAISHAIEDCTDSPWSHIAMVWMSPSIPIWLTLEATFEQGVHVGRLRDYVDGYQGDLVLAECPELTTDEIDLAITAGLQRLGNHYDTDGLIKTAIARALHHQAQPNACRQYCSELQWYMRQATKHPLAHWETPELGWLDATVYPVCALLKGAS